MCLCWHRRIGWDHYKGIGKKEIILFDILVRVIPLSVGFEVMEEIPPFSGGLRCSGMHFALKAFFKLASFGA